MPPGLPLFAAGHEPAATASGSLTAAHLPYWRPTAPEGMLRRTAVIRVNLASQQR